MPKGFLSLVSLLVSVTVTLNGCRDRLDEKTPISIATDPASEQSLSIVPKLADSPSWINVYDPDLAYNGYTLAFFMRRMPILMDMNGRVVHSWPQARVKSRLRLSDKGNLLAIGLDRSVVEYDWDGTEIWRHTFSGQTPHHEVIWLENDNVLTVVRPEGSRTDEIIEIDRSGDIVWRWSGQRLEPFFGEAASKGDITHINSVQELFDNPWYDDGDDRFRPGNLLVSARNLNLIFIIDRTGDEVVWTYDFELDLQHEALMIDQGIPGHGNILLFNNGYRSTYAYRQSSVLQIDPITHEVLWKWAEKGFYTSTGGIEQPLPNGNLLISSSRGGRAFEVTQDGRIVWQWAPPYDPNRPQRYAYDHCPQLATIDRLAETAVEPAPGYRYIDPDTYQFARRGALNKINIDGVKVNALINGNDCRSLLLPDSGVVHVAFGLNRRPLRKAGYSSYAVEFALSLSLEDTNKAIPLMEDRVDLSSETWRTRVIDLSAYDYQTVDLCVSTTRVANSDSDRSIDFAHWANPFVVSNTHPQTFTSDPNDPATDLTAEELAAQQEHLKALGYLD
jgi:hypothetical protein